MAPRYTDWDACFLPGMPENLLAPSQSAEILCEMVERFSVNRFFMTPQYDCSMESVAEFLLRRNRAFKSLQALLPPNVFIKPGVRVVMCPELLQTPDLEKLLLFGNRYLPLLLPINFYEDWMDQLINYLLYKKKFRLMFYNVETAVTMYKKEPLERMLKLPYALYHFGYRAFSDPKIAKIIDALQKRNVPVLFGTGIKDIEKVYFYEFDYYIDCAEKLLPLFRRDWLIRKSKQLWRLE